MKRVVFALAMISCLGASVSIAAAQEYTQKTWQVVNGDTTILFAPAGGQDLNMLELQTFGQIADENPAMARALARHPSLIENDAFVSKYPQLQQFLAQYPNAREHFLADPGNFVVPMASAR